MTYLTVPLNNDHKKKEFSCGKPLLDIYFQTQAKQDVKRKLSACFVLADDENNVKGYFTLSSASITRSILTTDIIKKLPHSYHDLPATLMGRLAVSNLHQGQGIGEQLLIDGLKRSYDTSRQIGSMAVVVDPIDAIAINFYLKYGFIQLPDSGKMFLSMDSIAQVFR